jgi:hypothetical protein
VDSQNIRRVTRISNIRQHFDMCTLADMILKRPVVVEKFTRFATNSKTRKQRFFERFYGLSGGAEAGLA